MNRIPVVNERQRASYGAPTTEVEQPSKVETEAPKDEEGDKQPQAVAKNWRDYMTK